ncbi:MAG: TIGR04283 family arsenosugar biosynthesis glycosyltransferase [Rhodanobacter sp.]
MAPRPVPAAGTLSVIVPLAPGETEWEGLLAQLAALPAGSEVVVVRAVEAAGGSAVDAPLPTGWPAHVRYRSCHAQAGRARQLNHGARSASGYWLWFLHADSRLRADSLDELRKFVASDRDGLGWFKLAFRRDGPRCMVLNALGANWRARWLGLPFGDQGLILPRHSFQALHGFDEHAAYGEDHLLVWAARRAGLPLRAIPATLETSARKYAQQGWMRTTCRHVWLTLVQAWPVWRALRRDRA